jgi:hypothetical protein
MEKYKKQKKEEEEERKRIEEEHDRLKKEMNDKKNNDDEDNALDENGNKKIFSEKIVIYVHDIKEKFIILHDKKTIYEKSYIDTGGMTTSVNK